MPRTLARQVTLARLIGHHRREGRARHPGKRGVHHHRRINHHQLRPVIPGQAQTAPRTPAAGTTGPQSSTVSPRLSGQPCRFLRHPSPNHLSPQIPRPVHSPRPCPIPRHLQTRRIHPRLHLPRRHRLIHRHVPLPARRVLPTGEVPPPRAATCRSQRRMAAAALRTVMRLPAPAPPYHACTNSVPNPHPIRANGQAPCQSLTEASMLSFLPQTAAREWGNT